MELQGSKHQINRNCSESPISFHRFFIYSFLFTIELEDAISLPGFKGDILHRAIGRGLEKVSPRAGHDFFNPDPPASWSTGHQTPPKPFFLSSLGDSSTDFKPGDTLTFGVTLFGHARLYLMILFAALEALGSTDGLVKGKGKFRIQRLQQLSLNPPLTLFANNCWQAYPHDFHAGHVIQNTPHATNGIQIRIQSLLDIRKDGRQVVDNLALPILIERLTGRINTLSAMYCDGLMLSPEERTALATLARSAVIDQNNLYRHEWPRNPESGNKMKLGGATGDISFTGVPVALLPWLNLGQWMGVGKKTSFGLGNYSLEIKPCKK